MALIHAGILDVGVIIYMYACLARYPVPCKMAVPTYDTSTP